MMAATIDPKQILQELGFTPQTTIHYQLSPEELAEQTVLRGQGVLNDTGALCIRTGEFTGRSPKDKFIVKDALTETTVDWNGFNIPIDEKYFHQLKKKLLDYLAAKEEVWVRDAQACADPITGPTRPARSRTMLISPAARAPPGPPLTCARRVRTS